MLENPYKLSLAQFYPSHTSLSMFALLRLAFSDYSKWNCKSKGSQ